MISDTDQSDPSIRRKPAKFVKTVPEGTLVFSALHMRLFCFGCVKMIKPWVDVPMAFFIFTEGKSGRNCFFAIVS